jgi:hypothetical protein
VERNASDLIKSYFDKKPGIYRRLRGYGWEVSENGSFLTIVSNGRSASHMNFMDIYETLDGEMKGPGYAAIMRTIEEKAEGYDCASVYGEVENAMKKMRIEDTEAGTREKGHTRPGDRRNLETGEKSDDLRVNLVDARGDAGESDPDARFAFADLVRASVIKTEKYLTVRMQLAGLPEMMTFNQSGVDDNQMEYQWTVLFDLDGNGTDDYSIDVIHFKEPGSGPVRGRLFENSQAGLWKVRAGGAEQVDVSVLGKKQGNEIVLEVPFCPFVSQIRKATRIRCSTYHTNGNNRAGDFLPD